EEDYTWERFIKDSLYKYAGDLLGSVPILSHAWDIADSAIAGRSFDGILTTFGIEQINDLTVDLYNFAKKAISGEISGKDIENLVLDGGSMLGIPMKNIKKFVDAGKAWAENAGTGEFDLSTAKGVMNYAYAGKIDYDTAYDMALDMKREYYYDKYPGATEADANEYAEEQATKAAKDAAHDRFMAAYEDGDYDMCETVKDYMRDNELYDDVGVTTKGWIDKYKDDARKKGEVPETKMTDSEEAALTAPDTALEKLKTAVESGEGVKAAVKELYDEMIDAEDGYVSQKRKKEIKKEIKDKINGKLIDMFQRAYYYGDKTEMERVRGIIRDTELYDNVRDTSVGWAENWEGYTEDKKQEKIKKWEDN
ncbi:MAG: hypothetical protein IKQ18_00215, partial [Clostridia bacterium]|nr:hypothetical protein [Clostridia bacterium]